MFIWTRKLFNLICYGNLAIYNYRQTNGNVQKCTLCSILVPWDTSDPIWMFLKIRDIIRPIVWFEIWDFKNKSITSGSQTTPKWWQFASKNWDTTIFHPSSLVQPVNSQMYWFIFLILIFGGVAAQHFSPFIRNTVKISGNVNIYTSLFAARTAKISGERPLCS